MENMEMMNEVINTEAIAEISEAVPTGKSGLKTAAQVGIIGAGAVALWEFAVKPIGRKVKGKLDARKTAKKIKKAKTADSVDENLNVEDMDLPEIPEIE